MHNYERIQRGWDTMEISINVKSRCKHKIILYSFINWMTCYLEIDRYFNEVISIINYSLLQNKISRRCAEIFSDDYGINESLMYGNTFMVVTIIVSFIITAFYFALTWICPNSWQKRKIKTFINNKSKLILEIKINKI